MPPHLIEAAGMLPYEQVDILNVNNGARFTTYIIVGEDDSICINGPAARLVQVGDKIIVCAYAQMSEQEAASHTPKVVLMQEGNVIADA